MYSKFCLTNVVYFTSILLFSNCRGRSRQIFKELNKYSYESYLKKYPFHLDLKIDLDLYSQNSGGRVRNKIKKDIYASVDPNNDKPFPAELDDLVRLHYLVISRKVTTILEFGVGKSSIVFDHALSVNKTAHESFVTSNMRRSNAFECHSVDNSKFYIKFLEKNHELTNTYLHYSKCRMGTFNGRICTYYDIVPNITPDLIYLDAPDQFGTFGNVRGISTRTADRLPMAADILSMEHFLLPGTLIVIDGRTANARFLKTNLQRNWKYSYYSEYDQHFFELIEEPLGELNKKQIDYCLPE